MARRRRGPKPLRKLLDGKPRFIRPLGPISFTEASRLNVPW
jgi:hypothetical protein